MDGFRMLIKWMKGNRLLYIGAIMSVGFATAFTLAGPLVLRFSIDSVIGNQPMELPIWIENIINSIGGRSILVQNLWLLSISLLILTMGRGIFIYFRGKWSAVASESIAKNIREEVYDHLQHLSYEYHVKAETGDLIQRCTSDIDTIRRFLAVQFVEIGQAIFMVAIVMSIMFSLNVKLTMIAMSVVPIIFVAAIVFFIKIRDAFKNSDEAEGRLSNVLQENLTGIRVVRAFARQQYEIDKFDDKNIEFRSLTYKLIKLLAGYWALSDLVCLLQIGAVLIFGAHWAAKGEISLGTLVVFTTYEGMLLWPVRQMGRILADFGKMIVSLNRIREIINEPLEITDEKLLKPEIKGDIDFQNVYFEYEKDRPILKELTFKVKKGQTVAILGPTGAGKSTLVHLLGRLYDYQGGSIKIDGVELKEIDKKWIRKNVGIILQEPFLYSKNIKENIKIAKKDAIDSQVYEAAQIASIHDVILDFEKGYETLVGERGVTLSGGQKQRVAIARTIINDYPILVFDDSLSAVDTETDANIRRALKSRKEDTTTFIISHRISTLAEADIILVLDGGQLVQSGTHQELISQQGLYRRIWDIQNSLEQELMVESKTV
ncbi:ATP-binding cassette, subfamily B [Proteiniborus ethanoligenes]|uniref:ATP-binding cassette, subfamily B n=1 Tax=Proteiniborus ethanoligenes TaxID=415015 RepID=A0A1H3RQ87_9FIRM|nr:ABC transporter ATP-binding protein [Proteiniborus ethanoligenes]SDZ27790.1 ATP-binding cassette, subfamily B [Proteiniborus ethanoligenes]